uniref:Uncharacterized protein n=1 Tax=Heterorhabditis bacteriophora TaxID=37862 RepID=A0A1I7X2P1_HETBA
MMMCDRLGISLFCSETWRKPLAFIDSLDFGQ